MSGAIRRSGPGASAARRYAALLGLMALVGLYPAAPVIFLARSRLAHLAHRLGLNGCDWRSWIIGGPAICATAWMAARIFPPVSWCGSVAGTLSFAGFFALESLRGGWDVARRALAPRLRLCPSMVSYPLRLPVGTARWLFCNSISLLPGTAVVAITEDRLLIHVLHTSPSVQRGLTTLEDRVAAVFSVKLPQPPSDVP